MDGFGNVLCGEKITLEQSAAKSAVYTTLDLTVQRAVEQATLDLPCGAAVLCDLHGAILAGVSRPVFDCTDLAASLDREDAPQMNRILTAYSVGSVFKSCVAAAGLESGIKNPAYTCKGTIRIDGRNFHCHRSSGHGRLSLVEGIQNSCNIYFYQYARTVGANAVLHMAQSLGFGSTVRLADGLYSARGNLPDKSELTTQASIFNFCIGQGSLLLCPLSMCTLYSAIAGDGTYVLPHLINAVECDGVKTKYENETAPTKVMSAQTARKLRKALTRVVAHGTGTAAQAARCTVAGKTATAQTGRFKNGKERTNGWFCGFFPADDPQYVGIVCQEDANGSDAAAVFSEIADTVMSLNSANRP